VSQPERVVEFVTSPQIAHVERRKILEHGQPVGTLGFSIGAASGVIHPRDSFGNGCDEFQDCILDRQHQSGLNGVGNSRAGNLCPILQLHHASQLRPQSLGATQLLHERVDAGLSLSHCQDGAESLQGVSLNTTPQGQ